MIVAAAAVVALAAPSRDALIRRWLEGNRTHTIARLHAAPPARTDAPVPDLGAMTRGELETSGRYQLAQQAAAPKAWWAPIWSWLADRWQKFWRGLFATVHVGKQAAASAGDVLLGIVALVLLVTVVRLVRNIQLTRAASPSPRAEPLGGTASASELYARACAAANQDDYGTAALLLFAATVALLDGRGALHASRAATVGDLRRQLRAGEAASVDSFDSVAEAFVQRAYAERAIAAPEWNRARFAYETLSRT